MGAYYHDVWRLAVAETKAYWTAHKLVTTIPGPLLALLAWTVFRGVPKRGDVMQVAIVSIIGFLAALGLTFLVSFVRAPKLLDDTRQSKISELNEHNRQLLSRPKRSPSEQHHYEQAKAALDELGLPAAIVLRHLEKHGQLIYRQRGPSPPAPANMTAQEMQSWLDRCVARDLVTPSHEWKATGGVTHKIEEKTYQIAPGMKAALDELLYSGPEES